MKTYIGLASCSRCGGGDPNCYVCTDPEEVEPLEEEEEDNYGQLLDLLEHLSDLKQDR